MNEKDRKKFYPYYLSEILLVVFLTLELVITFAMIFPAGIGRLIDFTSPYQPRPEWYFLWLYQLARYFPGKLAFIGTVIIPSLAIFLIIYLPWIDRGKWGRMKVLIISAFILIAFIILTVFPFITI